MSKSTRRRENVIAPFNCQPQYISTHQTCLSIRRSQNSYTPASQSSRAPPIPLPPIFPGESEWKAHRRVRPTLSHDYFPKSHDLWRESDSLESREDLCQEFRDVHTYIDVYLPFPVGCIRNLVPRASGRVPRVQKLPFCLSLSLSVFFLLRSSRPSLRGGPRSCAKRRARILRGWMDGAVETRRNILRKRIKGRAFRTAVGVSMEVWRLWIGCRRILLPLENDELEW